MPPWGVPVIVSSRCRPRIRHGFEERLDQTQDTLVSDSGSQPVHRPICEISSKQLDTPRSPSYERERGIGFGDGVMRPTLRAETVATGLESPRRSARAPAQGRLGNPFVRRGS